MSIKTIFSIMFFLPLLSVSAYANPDGTIIEGDLRIMGPAGVSGLVFPDGSTQYSAASNGPVTASPPLTGSGTSASPLGISVGNTTGTVAAGNDPRLSDARIPLAGSSNYIQNSPSPQAASFNINGDGTIGGNLNLSGLVNPLRVPLGTTPPVSSPIVGQLFFNTITNTLMFFNGSSWSTVYSDNSPHIRDITVSVNGLSSGASLSTGNVGLSSPPNYTVAVWRDMGGGTWENVIGNASYPLTSKAGSITVTNNSGLIQNLRLVVVGM